MNGPGQKGDIYIVTKGRCGLGRVGLIPASYHETLRLGNLPSNEDVPAGAYIYPLPALMDRPPKQGIDITCDKGAFRSWQGADMTRDGRLIAMITGESPARVYFYPRETDQSVLQALTAETSSIAASCPYMASTSFGLPNENKFESVAFLPDGKSFADTSECDGGRPCNVPIYFWDLVYPGSPDIGFTDGLLPASDDPGWSTITLDDFESGDHLGSYTPGAKANSTTDFACGAGSSWSLLVHDDSGAVSSFYHTQNQDASRFSWLKIRFDFLMDGFDHMDALFLELSLDGGATYFIVADWAKDNRGLSQLDVCYSETVALNVRAFDRITFGDQVRLRFRTSANALNDKVFIDNIWFQGHE